jgi:hypothetical protein
MPKQERIRKFPDYLDDRIRTKVLRYGEFDDDTPEVEEEDEDDMIPSIDRKNSLMGNSSGGKQNLTIVPMLNMP